MSAVELLDGSWLGVVRASDTVVRELEAWALVTSDPRDEPPRAGGVWEQAFEAGPLLIAIFSGVIGNAVWSAFPAAARYLSNRREPALDTSEVARRVQSAAEQAFGAGTNIVVRDVRRDGDGCWRAAFERLGGESGSARLTEDGVVVHLSRDTSAT